MAGSPPFEQFFAYRRFFPVAQLTPDGMRVLYVSNRSGQFNLWAAGSTAVSPSRSRRSPTTRYGAWR
jgi:hypothetical protein